MARTKTQPEPKSETPSAPWKNRIVGYGTEAPDQLLANDRNWRIHPKFQQTAITDVLTNVGLVQNVIVNRTTGKVIDGHMRIELAISQGQPEIPITYVELSEEEERTILASLDPIGSLAVSDTDKLSDLLGDITVDSEALDSLFGSLIDTASKTTPQADDGTPSTAERSQARGGPDLGDAKVGVKPVIYSDQVSIFERALRATGEVNRGEALIAVCQAYLDAKDA